MKTDQPLTIVRLTASNVMRLKAGVEIIPRGNTVVVTGKNKQGKSAVLNCILFALGGKSVLPDKPVRTGALKADIHIDLGQIVVDWKCSQAGSVSLLVREKEGGEIKSPQQALNALWNQMCDPVKFIRQSESPEGRRKQAETLRQIVGLDFAELDKERASLYEEREDKGRDVKRLTGHAQSLAFHADTPEQEVSVTDLMQKLEEINQHNSTIDSANNNLARLASTMESAGDEVAGIKDAIGELERQLTEKRKALEIASNHLADATRQHGDYKAQLATMERKDGAAIRTQVANAETINQRVRENAARRKADKELADTENRYQVLTRQIEEIDEEKRTKLGQAKFPVDGLSFDENGILLDGLPFSQGSQAEQLVAATAIGLALSPRIRVVLLRDASLLDAETRKQVAGLAEREKAQVWEEMVESDDPSAIVIEDGQIKGKK